MDDGAAYFGAEVRAWRTHMGLTQKTLAIQTGYAPSYVAMVETGKRLGSEQFAESLDGICRTPETFARLRERASRYPDWFAPYVELERKATKILSYSSNLVMGMLQTEAYAHAVFQAVAPRDDPEVTREKVNARLRRRQIMERDEPPLLWVVLDESCLRRPVGGRDVMSKQLAHLLQEAESPHITLQVLPFSSGAPPRAEPFVVLTFADSPDIMFVENHDKGQVIDSPTDVEDAADTYDRLRADALSPRASVALIREVREELFP